MTAQNLRALILPRLLSGARDGLALDKIKASSPLQALSLAGQALRFDRPAHPAQFLVEAPVEDERRIVPDPARKLMVRLLAGKSPVSTMMAVEIARTLDLRALRLHPFDLPKLESFVKAHAEALGAEAMAFSQREAPTEQKQSYFASDMLTDETWMVATPALKARFIASRREIDPAGALALLKISWGSENADNRFRLLNALRAKLSPADAEFLESLAQDRAPRVRELGRQFLARLPGFVGDNPALNAALERIKRAKIGLIFRKTVLTLQTPATVQQNAISVWVRQTFADIGFSALAGSLKMSPEEIIEAAQKDAPLLLACLIMATDEKRLDLVGKIVSRLDTAWSDVVQGGFGALAGYTPEERSRWADLVVQPKHWNETATLWTLTSLIDLLDGPASEQLMRDFLASRAWLAFRQDPTRLSTELIECLAVLCPPSMRPALRSAFASLDANLTHSAALFVDLMDILEAHNA
ncbi:MULTISPECIES: DUF5691 domain-containing protein [unclassified Rhizobium]|uniref:DUF5691 domain-containing protein n=1 Tax=unclassified Rhizobium TaxID=2613769 RepID=UPI000AD7910C|nr:MULTISPECIES: DUF5691 domain-containing protein [unclassified Rhizobium]